MEKFQLSENFINKYKRKKPPFGFNGLGELVYMRTYSRIKENGKNERWWETVQRVVEGTYSMQKYHIESHLNNICQYSTNSVSDMGVLDNVSRAAQASPTSESGAGDNVVPRGPPASTMQTERSE